VPEDDANFSILRAKRPMKARSSGPSRYSVFSPIGAGAAHRTTPTRRCLGRGVAAAKHLSSMAGRSAAIIDRVIFL
jgi:hypothetical protein